VPKEPLEPDTWHTIDLSLVHAALTDHKCDLSWHSAEGGETYELAIRVLLKGVVLP
jgi:hypothetical protein